jgi:hypothetical protein
MDVTMVVVGNVLQAEDVTLQLLLVRSIDMAEGIRSDMVRTLLLL